MTRVSNRQLLRAGLAALAAAVAPSALGAPGSVLDVTMGPHETTWLAPKELKVRLDGAPLPMSLPAAGADPAAPIHSEVIRPGKHVVEVEAGFVGDSNSFNYVEGYVFRMNGKLDIDAPPAEGVVLNIKVVKRGGLTVEWTDKFKLALKAGKFVSERTAAATVPDVEPPAAVAAADPAPTAGDVTKPPAPQPTPAVFTQRQGAGACSVDPPHFRFAKKELQAADRARLSKFADCLKGSGDAVLVAGHTDPIGSREYNDWLSAERAAEVVEFLANQGVERSRLAITAYGFTRLLCTEKTPGCNARNRRAEAITSQP